MDKNTGWIIGIYACVLIIMFCIVYSTVRYWFGG